MRLLLVLPLLLPLLIHGQRHDWGHWYAGAVETKIQKGWNVSGQAALRFDRQGAAIGQWFAELESTYKLTDRLRLEGEWRWGYRNRDGWGSSTRWAGGFRLKQDWGKTEMSWRSRYQLRSNGRPIPDDRDFSSAWRNRIRIKQKLKKRLWLSVSGEAFLRSAPDGYTLQTWRSGASLRWKLDKRLYLTTGVLVETALLTVDPLTEWIADVSIRWTWKRKNRRTPETTP